MDFLHIESSPERLWDCFETNDIGYIIRLSDAGKAALARYDVEWVTVRRETLSILVAAIRTAGLGSAPLDVMTDVARAITDARKELEI
jgi:hypothetical protein